MAENASFDVLIDRPAVFAVDDDKKREGKEKDGITVIRRYTIYISAICEAYAPGPIPVKIGVRFAPHDVIKMSNFCNKMF